MPSLPNDPRPRYEGDAETLAAAILPSTTNAGWLHYSTEMKDKIDVARIRTHAALIQRLYLLQQNLSFTKTQVEAAMEIVLLQSHFRLADKHSASWVKVTALRMRAMCRHVSNTRKRPSRSGSNKCCSISHRRRPQRQIAARGRSRSRGVRAAVHLVTGRERRKRRP